MTDIAPLLGRHTFVQRERADAYAESLALREFARHRRTVRVQPRRRWWLEPQPEENSMTARPDVPRPPVVEWEPIRLLLNRPAWHSSAACRGTELAWWFPGRGESSRRQKQMCRGCPVQQECFAANHDERFGIFGGTSERERRRMRSTKGKAA